MKCPHCGSHVQDEMDVCPHCNKQIQTAVEDDAPTAWCESCGSMLPEGATECPVCGMPVAGAYDEAEEEAGNDADEGQSPSPELASALPPAPKPGEDRAQKDAPTRMRLVVVTAIASLFVVGGTALYITRPWDPNAYMIHATEDADTSQEGHLQSVSHLTGQDLIEDAERVEYLKNAEAKVDELKSLMKETSDCCAKYEAQVDGFLESGEFPEVSGVEELGSYRERIVNLHKEVADLDLRGSSREELAKKEMVVAEYLEGRVDTLHGVCETFDGTNDAASATVAVEAKMTSGAQGRSLEEWRQLYENAYAGLEP